MSWLAENWIWVLFGVAFIAMHMFGHGGHGGHGGHRGHGSGAGNDGYPKKMTTKPVKGPGAATPASPAKPHRH